MIEEWKSSTEYKLISKFYGKKVAARSKVPLINHINEGLEILEAIGASKASALGFCLHPLVQDKKQLKKTLDDDLLISCSFEAINAAFEYRYIANAYLCEASTDGWNTDKLHNLLSPICDTIRDMLIADKIQNRKDFLLYHATTHSRAPQLLWYFNNWIDFLSELYGKDLNEYAYMNQ